MTTHSTDATRTLSPAQARVVEGLKGIIAPGRIGHLWVPEGLGRSTMLKSLQQQSGGVLLTMRDFVELQVQGGEPHALEETFYRMVAGALKEHTVVYVDDLQELDAVVGKCQHFYPRAGMLDIVLGALCDLSQSLQHCVVWATSPGSCTSVSNRAYSYGFKHFTAEDYEFFLEAFLQRHSDKVDFQQLYRHAARLNARQLQSMCERLLWTEKGPTSPAEFVISEKHDVSTERAIRYLLELGLGSNVSLGDVENIDLYSLKGNDEAIAALETHVILPFECPPELHSLDLRPKRGVLLHGPPGTGKTSIGRALAHRLRGKFFLIDGTMIAGSRDFYERLESIVESARNNSPAVIFIDDSDVLFEDESDTGLYRFLLTMLDGLENDSGAVVCTMMTVMDVASVPRALIRSGRLELWLELKLPDAAARDAILQDWLVRLPDELGAIDRAPLVETTQGLTGADLRRLVNEAKHYHAMDTVRRSPILPFSSYLERSVKVLRENHAIRASAEARALGRPVASC